MSEAIDEVKENILSYLRENRDQEARQKLEEALQTFPDQRDIWLLGSDVHRVQDNREQSLALCRQLIDRDPTDWEALGRIAEDLKFLDRCEEWIELGVIVRTNLPTDIHPHLAAHDRLRFIGSCLAENPLRVQLWALTLRDPESSPSQNTPVRAEDTRAKSVHSPVPFQYWSQGNRPEALQNIADLWNAALSTAGLPAITLFDKRSARKWLNDHAPNFLRCFDSAYHYAIEADIFRIAFASSKAALYLDCDNYPTPLSANILQNAIREGGSTLYFRTHRPAVANSFFISSDNCPFFRHLAAIVEQVDFTGKPKDWRFLYEVGPWIYTKTLDMLIENQSSQLISGSPPPGIPRLDFGSSSLGFIVEKRGCLQRPPFRVKTPEWSHWQKSLPREGLR